MQVHSHRASLLCGHAGGVVSPAHPLARSCAPTGSRAAFATLLAGLAFALALGACGPYPQTTIEPASDFAAEIHQLYVIIFWWTMVILAVVWAVLGYVLIKYPYRPGRWLPPQTRGNLLVEIAWTAAPAFIVVLITMPTIQAIFRTQSPPPANALEIEVIGHQWWWEFRYVEDGITTANELHLPVGRPITLTLRSADVIHSFWVPRLGGKRDVNPLPRLPDGAGSRPNRLTFTVSEPGRYFGQCAEFCGLSHALMRIDVVAEDSQQFDAWLRAMRAPSAPEPGTLEQQGAEIFLRSTCVVCHTIAGTTAQGAVGPSLTRLGARRSIGAGILENTTENLVRWITDPASVKPGALMPGIATAAGAFPPTGLSPQDVAAVAAYLRSLQ